VVTANGTERVFWEMNFRLKIDSSAYGPKGDKPVLVEVGAQGDRVALVFSGLSQISTFIQSKCSP
jgi:cytochrome c